MDCQFYLKGHLSCVPILADNAPSMFNIRFPKPNTAMQESSLESVSLSCYVSLTLKRRKIYSRLRAILGLFCLSSISSSRSGTLAVRNIYKRARIEVRRFYVIKNILV